MSFCALPDRIRRLKMRDIVSGGLLRSTPGLRPSVCVVLSLVLALAAAGVSVGCGRKLPPSPPGVNPPVAVRDLAASLSGDSVALTWSHVAPRGKVGIPAAGYKVFRSRIEASEKDCTTCPSQFKVIGELLAQSRQPGSRMRFSEELEPGYHYRYKVVAYAGDGAHSGDSNVVEVTR